MQVTVDAKSDFTLPISLKDSLTHIKTLINKGSMHLLPSSDNEKQYSTDIIFSVEALDVKEAYIVTVSSKFISGEVI